MYTLCKEDYEFLTVCCFARTHTQSHTHNESPLLLRSNSALWIKLITSHINDVMSFGPDKCLCDSVSPGSTLRVPIKPFQLVTSVCCDIIRAKAVLQSRICPLNVYIKRFDVIFLSVRMGGMTHFRSSVVSKLWSDSLKVWRSCWK